MSMLFVKMSLLPILRVLGGLTGLGLMLLSPRVYVKAFERSDNLNPNPVSEIEYHPNDRHSNNKLYTQIQDLSTEEYVVSLAHQLKGMEYLDNRSFERNEIITTLLSINSEASIKELATVLAQPVLRSNSYSAVIMNGVNYPETVFSAAQVAFERIQPILTGEDGSASGLVMLTPARVIQVNGPVSFFIPALTGEVFTYKDDFWGIEQNLINNPVQDLNHNEIDEWTRLGAVAALSNASYDTTNELILALPADELSSVLIDVIGQGESLCGMNNINRAVLQRIVEYSNKILVQVGEPFFILLSEAALHSTADSNEKLALEILEGALRGDHI